MFDMLRAFRVLKDIRPNQSTFFTEQQYQAIKTGILDKFNLEVRELKQPISQPELNLEDKKDTIPEIDKNITRAIENNQQVCKSIGCNCTIFFASSVDRGWNIPLDLKPIEDGEYVLVSIDRNWKPGKPRMMVRLATAETSSKLRFADHNKRTCTPEKDEVFY